MKLTFYPRFNILRGSTRALIRITPENHSPYGEILKGSSLATKEFLDSRFGIKDFADNTLPYRGLEVATQLDVNLHELRAAEPDWSVLVEAAKITLIFAKI